MTSTLRRRITISWRISAHPLFRAVFRFPRHIFTIEVLPRLSDGADGRWRWGRDTAQSRINELMARQVGPTRRWDAFQIDALERDGAERRAIPKTVWDGPEVANEAGTLELRKLMGKRIFDTPKPTGLIRQILEHTVSDDALILDFFAGSGSTAHAVALMNAADGGTRRVISVNIQEPTPEASDARKHGYQAVSDITRDRLAAVMETVPGAQAQGLRTYRLGHSNFRGAVASDELDLSVSTLAWEETDWQAIAAEVLLKEGIALDENWDRINIGDTEVVVAGGVAVVLSDKSDDTLVEAVLQLKTRVVVFMEDGFAGADAVKANAFTNAKNAGITMKTA